MASLESQQLHGTAVSVDGRGVLLRGRTGSGKSDLALRLIDRGALLIADDRVDIVRRANALIMSAPIAIAGFLEVRGLGIVELPYARTSSLALVIDLVPRDRVERLPDPEMTEILGLPVPLVRLDPFEASAPIKVAHAMEQAPSGIQAGP